MDGNAAFAKLKANSDRKMTMMGDDDSKEEADEYDLSRGCLIGCWKTFLPSMPRRMERLIIDTPPAKSVHFQLEENITHLVKPWFTEMDVSYENLFVGGNEIQKTESDMEATATFFRRLYRLESVPNKDDDQQDPAITTNPSDIRLEDVSTIGLEWLIWPDNRWKRHYDIIQAIEWYFNKSLAHKCQVISKASKKEARERAEWVVQELKSTANSTTKGKQEEHSGVDIQMLLQKGVLMRSREATVEEPERIPSEIYIPVAVWCSSPASFQRLARYSDAVPR